MLGNHQKPGRQSYDHGEQDQRSLARPKRAAKGREATIVSWNSCLWNGTKKAHCLFRAIFKNRNSMTAAPPLMTRRPSGLIVSRNAPRSMARIPAAAAASSFD